MGSWQQRELDVALDLQSPSANLPVIPVLLPGCEPPLGFLRQLTWMDLRTRTLDLGVAILAKVAHGEAPGQDLQKHLDSVRAAICPYRGLLHFREEDAPFFFGRQAAMDKLADAVQGESFVTIVGASRSGKSSVVPRWACAEATERSAHRLGDSPGSPRSALKGPCQRVATVVGADDG